MKLWHQLPEPGEYWRFDRYIDIEGPDFQAAMRAATEVFAVLWPVMRPLSVEIDMGVRRRTYVMSEYPLSPPIPTWSLHEMDSVAIAAWIKTRQPSKKSEEAIPGITTQALEDWLARAHAQQLSEEYVADLRALKVRSTRARLLEHQEPSAELALDQQTFVLPIEKREDGLWVSGPLLETTMSPPIEIELRSSNRGYISLEEDQTPGSIHLILRIFVHWSPWIETGSAEAELLTACLHELENQGWN